VAFTLSTTLSMYNAKRCGNVRLYINSQQTVNTTVDIGLHVLVAYFVWVAMIWRFLTAIWQKITLRLAVSTENYLATLTWLRCTVREPFCMYHLLYFCKLPTNPNINFELNCILKKHMKRRFQWYLVRTEILSTFHTRVEYISITKYAIESNGSVGQNTLETTPSPCSTWTPIKYTNAWADSTHLPIWQLDRFTHFCTTTQQCPHWLQWDAPNSPRKLPFPFDDNYPI